MFPFVPLPLCGYPSCSLPSMQLYICYAMDRDAKKVTNAEIHAIYNEVGAMRIMEAQQFFRAPRMVDATCSTRAAD